MPTLRRWISAIYAAKLSPACRDTLIAYSAFMDNDGLIQVRRKEIEEWTGRPASDIARHIRKAVNAGLLDVEQARLRGRPTTYRATVPPTPRRANAAPMTGAW
jgi:hypothetical protein